MFGVALAVAIGALVALGVVLTSFITYTTTVGAPAQPIAAPAPAYIPPQQPQKPHRETVAIQNLLPMVTTPGDSTGEMLSIRDRRNADGSGDDDPFHYELCSFTNVCANSDSLHLFVQDEAEYNNMQSIISRCHTVHQYRAPEKFFHPCHCFLPQFQMKLLPYWRRAHEASEKPITSVAQGESPSTQRHTPVHPLAELNQGHFFSIHKYVGKQTHHIAHWAQKIVLFQSAMQHSHTFPSPSIPNDYTYYSYNSTSLETTSGPYPIEHYTKGAPPFGPLDGLVLHDMLLPMSEHETGIFNTSLQAVLADSDHPGLTGYFEGKHLKDRSRYHQQHGNNIFADELDHAFEQAEQYWTSVTSKSAKAATTVASAGATVGSSTAAAATIAPAFPRCYSRLTFTRAFGIFSTSSLDTATYRRLAYQQHGLEAQLEKRCPPRRIVFLYRENRGILNWEDIGQIVKQMSGKDMIRETIDGTSSSRRQVELFASAGMLLSSHSSQLVNVLYSHPHSTMIEVTGEYYNSDFSEYAHGMGVHFTYAIGGHVPDGESDDRVKECTAILAPCLGDSHCILRERYKCPRRSFTNKNRNFNADLQQVKVAVRNALKHLDWICGGKW